MVSLRVRFTSGTGTTLSAEEVPVLVVLGAGSFAELGVGGVPAGPASTTGTGPSTEGVGVANSSEIDSSCSSNSVSGSVVKPQLVLMAASKAAMSQFHQERYWTYDLCDCPWRPPSVTMVVLHEYTVFHLENSCFCTHIMSSLLLPLLTFHLCCALPNLVWSSAFLIVAAQRAIHL